MTDHNTSALAYTREGGSPLPALIIELSADDGKTVAIDLHSENVRSHIAEGDEFIGDFRCATGIRISGKIVGSVNCKAGAIVIERTGHVTGSIQGTERIFIDGKVGGESEDPVTVTSPGTVSLMSSANVNANISYGRLATYGDMTHNGTCQKITSR